MKTIVHKITCLFILLYSFVAYPQNKTADSLKNAIDSLKKVLQTQKEDTNKVSTLISISQAFLDVSDYSHSIEYANNALKLSNKLNFKKGMANAFLYKSANNYDLSNYPQAIKDGETCVKLMKEIKDKRGCAFAYRYLSSAHGMQGDYIPNVQYAYASLKLWEEIGDNEMEATQLNDLGNIYISHDNYAEGYIYAEKALQMSKETGQKDLIAYSLGLLSDIDIKNGKLSDALTKRQEALKILKEAGDNFFNYYAADHYRSIGKIYQKQGETALDSGNKLTATEMFSNAQVNYREALKYDIKKDNKSFIATEYISLADIDILFNKRKEADSYLKKALALAKSVGYKFATRDAYYSLSRLDSINENYKQAYENYKMYVLYRDSVVNEESAKKAVQTQMQYEFDKKEALAKAKQDEKDALAAAELKNQKLIRNFSLSGIVAVIFFAGYSFYRYRRKKTLQNQQALMNERLRISRELHDEVGATLSGIAMYSHLTKEQIKQANTGEVEKSLNIMQHGAGEMVNKLNDIVWLINPDQDSLQKLIQRLEEYARDMAAIKNMSVKVNVPEHLHEHSLPMESRRNIYLFCKEAINNAVKYSNGTLLELNIKEVENKLEFSVSDNGKGFDAVMVRRGNGLENMQKRADEVGAKLTVQSKHGEGSLVSMQLKITH